MRHTIAFLAVLTLLSGCSRGTAALDKAKAMASKVQILKSELIMGDPAEYSGHRHQQLKLTIKNDNAEPVESMMGHLVMVDQNGKELDLDDEVLFAADPDMGATPVRGFTTKEGIIGKAFTSYNQIEGSSAINVFQIKSITSGKAFSSQDHFMRYIDEKPH